MLSIAAAGGNGGGYPGSGGLQLAVGSNKSAIGGSGTSAGVPRIQHIAAASVQSPISPSTAELNMKIASVKKVLFHLYLYSLFLCVRRFF